ncbi:MAG: His/Gly/Thr/Pro-type tRNA ligase C-terminal domain-containing protein, partial [Actinomycetota bacterium]
YQAQRAAYIRVFERLGLDYVIVSAMSGAMGGSKSEEFLSPTPIGEDTYVSSPGGYAANVEAVSTPVPESIDWTDAPEAHVEDTPDTPTIDTLVAVANERFPRADREWTAADTLKNVVLAVTSPAKERSLLVVGLPGDRDADMARLEAALSPSLVEAASEDDFKAHPQLVKGYIGPGALGPQARPDAVARGSEGDTAIPYLLDPRVVPGTRWITGADAPGRHVFELTAGRDFVGDGTIEAATVRAGDPAPDGSGPLSLARGVEIGHIFQLGRKYAEALDLKVLDENGKQVVVTMGSYGIGVTRALALLAENNNDELGLAWPIHVAPYHVHIVATGKEDAVFEASEALAAAPESAGVEVCYDDRPKVSPGVKFKDAELIGSPFIAVVGRGLENGTIELKTRGTGASEELPVSDAAAEIAARVTAALAGGA